LSGSTVLVVTNERDVGADFVVRELDGRGIRVIRLNTERAPQWKLTLTPGTDWSLSRGGRALGADRCAGVWWRRPEVPESLAVDDPAAVTLGDQWRVFLAALATVPGPTWVSEPGLIRTAESKALQLRSARELGFSVPATLWTNDVDEARHFVDSCGGTAVVKSVTTAWWEAAGRGHFVYASLVRAEDLPVAERLALAPVCLQSPVQPKRDIRVTVVEHVVLAAVRADSTRNAEEPLDWRRAPQHFWSRYALPADVADGCRALVASFGLRFGAIDLAVDDIGTHWFLELNPNGEWGWLQRAGLPIAEALADTLLRQLDSAAR
jgi:hypothetical protein